MQVGQRVVFTNKIICGSKLRGNLVLEETYYVVVRIYEADEYLDTIYEVIDRNNNTHCGFWHEFETV